MQFDDFNDRPKLTFDLDHKSQALQSGRTQTHELVPLQGASQDPLSLLAAQPSAAMHSR